MNYHFIAYRANEMIAGDWGWYLDTYSTEPSGMRVWTKDGQLTVQAYEEPKEFKRHVLTHVIFSPPSATKEDRHRPRGPEVRWGIVTCLRKDLADLLGPVLDESATVGQLRLRGGEIVREWIPVIFKHRLPTPDPMADGPAETVRHIRGEALCCSHRYSMIVRDDIFQVIRGFHFEGCHINRHAAAESGPGKLL